MAAAPIPRRAQADPEQAKFDVWWNTDPLALRWRREMKAKYGGDDDIPEWSPESNGNPSSFGNGIDIPVAKPAIPTAEPNLPWEDFDPKDPLSYLSTILGTLQIPGQYLRGGIESLGSALGLRDAPADWGHRASWGTAGDIASDPFVLLPLLGLGAKGVSALRGASARLGRNIRPLPSLTPDLPPALPAPQPQLRLPAPVRDPNTISLRQGPTTPDVMYRMGLEGGDTTATPQDLVRIMRGMGIPGWWRGGSSVVGQVPSILAQIPQVGPRQGQVQPLAMVGERGPERVAVQSGVVSPEWKGLRNMLPVWNEKANHLPLRWEFDEQGRRVSPWAGEEENQAAIRNMKALQDMNAKYGGRAAVAPPSALATRAIPSQRQAGVFGGQVPISAVGELGPERVSVDPRFASYAGSRPTPPQNDARSGSFNVIPQEPLPTSIPTSEKVAPPAESGQFWPYHPLPQPRYPSPAPGLEPGTLGTRTIGGEVSPVFNPPGMPDTDDALAIPSSGWVRRFPNWVVRQTIPEEKSNLPSPVGQATATGDYYHQTPEEFQGPLSREAQIAQQNLAIARANREAMRGPYAAIPSVSQARGPRGMQASEVPGGAGVPVTPGFDRNTWRQLGRASDERQAAERAMTADQRIAPADLQGRADAAKANMEARMRAKGYEQVQVMGADGQPIAGRTTWQKATPGIPYAATMQQPGNPAQAAVNRREPPPMPTIPIAQADAAMRARERQDQLHREAVRQGWAVKPNGGQPRYDEATGAPLGPVMHVNPMNDAWRRQEMARGRINAWRHGIAPGATVRAPAATAPALPQVEIPGLPPPNAGSMNVGAMLGGSVPAIPGMGSPQDLTNLGWSTVMPGMGGDPNVPATPQRRPIGTTTANRRRSPAFPGLPGGGFEQYNLPLAANGLTTPITGPSKISITPLTGPKSGIPHGVAIAGEEGPENMVIAPNAYNQGNPYVESYNRNWNQLSDIAEMVRQGREQAQQNASLGGMNTREKLGWMRQQGEDRRDENRMIVEGEQLKLGNRRADAQEAWQRGQLERQNATEARLAEYQQKNLEWQQQEKRMNDARDAYTISMQNVMRLTQPGSGATPEDIQLAKDDLEIRKAAYYAISGGPTPVLPSKPAKPPFKTEKEEATAGGDKETPTEYRTRVENNARIVKREAIRSGIVDQGGSAWWQPYGPDGNFDESAMFAHILKVLKASGAWDENQLEAEAKALTRKMMAEKARRMSLSPEQRKAEFGQKTRPGISTPGLGLY